MRPRLPYWTRAALTVTVFGAAVAAAWETRPLEYDRDVRPILSENCFPCHGQDSKKRMAGLRLDTAEGATADRGGHSAITPNHPETSALYQRITAAGARRMPPAYSNRHLTPDQIATLKRWIEEGGRYTKHWSFIPPARPAIPKVSDRAWIKQPIDAFVLQRLDAEGLKPRPAATPAAWLRRVSLALTGIPATPAELDAFTADAKTRGEAAYSAAVDRLLASPRYGERMAMDWLDVAHYADTHGFNNDSERSMWRWRDWVIDAFNADMPYDRFLTEQLAGDLLPHPTLDQRIATGFGRNGVINSEGGIIEEEYRVEYVTDRVRTLGMAWMGLTLECAHCHDHKFDPITQRDHYRFFSFFNNVPELGEDGRTANAVPMIPAPTAEQQQRMRAVEAAIAKLEPQVDRARQSWKPADPPTPAAPPDGAFATFPCESLKEFDKPQSPTSTPTPPRTAEPTRTTDQSRDRQGAVLLAPDGIAGHACVSGEGKPELGGPAIPIWRRGPATFSLWVRPDSAGGALLSTMNYATAQASTTYGSGIELRLEDGELEFRWADRYPAYSVRVRSRGAHVTPGKWTHLALVYEGLAGRDALRVKASWIRMFADGRELPTHVFHDGLSLPGETSKPSMTRFRLGWDTTPGGAPYKGRLDDLAIWTRALTPVEIEALFETRAIPYALAHPAENAWLRDAALRRSDPDVAQLDALRADLYALQRSAPSVMVMEEMPTPRETHILQRGSYASPGDKVEAGVPEDLLGAWPAGAPKNRLGLAQWLTKPDHPLTARVVVNRFWQQLFGQGIVKTSDNFGMQGEWPTHPELLDWLAREFVDNGWNVKALLKRIVLSSTFRQDSAAPADLIARDPENRLLARGPRFRLPAEILRDQALAVSGLLKHRLGGPSVFPYQEPGLYKGVVVDAAYPGTRYIDSKGDDLYRRSLYTYWKRTLPHPVMTVFDAPDREFCIVRRSATNTPLQALTLLNNPMFVEAARKLAERAILEGGSTPDARLAYAFRLATGRAPDAEERKILTTKLDAMLAAYRADEAAARAFIAVGESRRDDSIAPAELAAWTAVANLILNMDEVITLG